MKLEIDLVPSTAWYSNLRKKVSQKDWDRIRKQSYAEANYRCAICDADSRLNCHEIWEYDDDTHIQKLAGFVALCNDCHMIKHLGFAGIQASKGLLDMDKLIDHFMKVNGVDINVFEDHRNHSFEQWRKRSTHPWETELSKWAGLVNSH